MIKHGAKRSALDRRDYSFHKTFPHFGASAPAELPLMNYNVDAGLTMPDQNNDGLPYGCTGYAQTDAKGSQEKKIYDPRFTYEKTCFMEGHDDTTGCDIRTSAKSLRVYGALPGDLPGDMDPDTEAKNHKSGLTFNVDKALGRDWFDSFRIALRAQSSTNTPISTGTIWFPEWASPDHVGLLSDAFAYDNRPNDYQWHDYNVIGEETIDGEPTLILKSWQGRNYGRGGLVYLNRVGFNRAFDIYGTIGIIVAQVHPGDIKTIDLDILQTVLDYLRRLLSLINLAHLVTVHA